MIVGSPLVRLPAFLARASRAARYFALSDRPVVEKIAAGQRRLIAASMQTCQSMSSNRSNVAYLPNKNDTQHKFVVLPTQNGMLNPGFLASD
jgi:hypothetical protein